MVCSTINNKHPSPYLEIDVYLTCKVMYRLNRCDTVGGNTLILTQVLVTRAHIPDVKRQFVWGKTSDGHIGLTRKQNMGLPVPC